MLRSVAGDSTAPATLDMWVIYDHPLDFPDGFLARRWFVTHDAQLLASPGDVMRSQSIDNLRTLMEQLGKYRIERDETDDPVVVETWI